MENQSTSPQNNKPVPIVLMKGKPLPMERHEKLKVFATASLHKDVPQNLLDEKKLSLSIVIAYNKREADQNINAAFVMAKSVPKDFSRQLQMSIDVEDVIKLCIPTATKVHGEPPKIEVLKEHIKKHIKEATDKVITEEVEKKKEKSVEELITYVLYVFDKVGSPVEKTMAKRVTDKFKEQK